MIITADRTIHDIQEEFLWEFPYLRLEFFTRVFNAGQISGTKNIKPSNKTLKECRTLQHEGSVNITPDLTVAKLNEIFRETYGLGIMVYRKSGKVWLETTVTDSWTLGEQNKQGEALSKTTSDSL